MFQYCYNLTNIDVGGFDTSKAIDMSFMFAGCKKITSVDVSNFNTSSVTGMNSMFAGCTSLTSVDVSNFNTSSVRVLSSMFSNCPKLEVLDITSFNVSNMRNALYMFSGSSGLKTIYCNDSWTSTGADGTDMFKDCSSLVGEISYAADKLDINYATPETGYFTYKQEKRDIIINGKTVTNLNEGDLTALPGVTGTASYDPDTKTLYLEDASITEMTLAGGYAIKTTLDTLHVNVEGECNISSSKGVGLHSNSRNVVIGGTGTLNIDASVAGIVMNSTATNSLDIDDEVTVNVEADTYGMVGREVVGSLQDGTDTIYYTTTLKVGGENSKLSVKGTEQSFLTLKAFEPADGYKVTSPPLTIFNPASNTFCRLLASFSGNGRITPGLPVLTRVPVAGVAVVIEKPYILGDVNGDGSITMADANMVVNYFLSTDPSSIANFNVTAADVNGDKAITMADANQIVNIFLGQ
ncbi:MAG: BspA family leucine-rich repeat surface protein [Prevotella sp.]|nr:BspA family leucine-rich repeat surface protein [Prevotella sp.]